MTSLIDLTSRLARIEAALDSLSPAWRDRAVPPHPGAKDGGGAPGVRASRSEKVVDQLIALAHEAQFDATQRGEKLSYREALQKVIAAPEHDALVRQVREQVRE